MKRIHRFAAVGVCAGALALIPAALAAGAAKGARGSAARGGVTAGAASGIPHTTIKGHPARWKPSKLSGAKGRWEFGESCTPALESVSIKNKEKKTEDYTVTGTKGFTPFSGYVLPGTTSGFCITKGYKGTLTATLTDGKKLKVKF